MIPEELIQSKLFGAGLVPMDTPQLVARYNECLIELGIEPSKRERFSIDGMGWSPEVAEERQDKYYLSAGISNQMGIIITPNQRNKPIYFPFHSYDRALMESYFSRFRGEIADITASRGIALDIDQELTSYESPADLRLVNYIIVRSSAGKLSCVARHQKSLVEKVLNSDEAWADRQLRGEIVQSSEVYGDLRYRKIDIGDLRFDELQTFYTRAFGGVFVIQTIDKRTKLLIFDDPSHLGPEAWKRDMFPVVSPETLELLTKECLLEINLLWYQSYPQALAYLKDCLTAEIICQNEPEIDYGELTLTQRKMKLASLREKVGDVYYELERLMKQLQSTAIPKTTHLSPQLKLLLLRPNRELPLGDQAVLRLLLHRVRKYDLMQLYADDKNLFYEEFQRWPNSKRQWAIEKIGQDYLVEGSQ